MAQSVISDPNYLCYKKGETVTITGVPAFGYITSSGKDASILFTTPYLLSNVNGVSVSAASIQMRTVSNSYLGGSTSFNPISDSTVSVSASITNSKNLVRILLSKTSSFGFTNNTPLFGTVNSITMTFS